MLNQLFFIISVYIVGAVFSILLFEGLKFTVRHYISPFFGIAFLSLSVGLLIIFNVSINLLSILIVLMIFWVLLYYLRYSFFIDRNKGIPLTDHWRYWLTKDFILLLLLYSIIGSFFVVLGKSYAEPDSTQFEGIGRFLANGGTVRDKPLYLAFLLNGRLLVVGAMHCINRLYGAYSLYALNSTIVIWFLGLATLLLNDLLKNNLTKKLKVLFLGAFVLVTVLQKSYYFQIFSIHSNAFAMIYFSLAVISLYLFSKSGIESWLTLGSFLMGIATLIRIDMLIFSLLYFVLFSRIVDDNYSALKKSWAVFIIVSIPWRLFTLSFTSFDVFYVSADQILLLLFAHIGLATVTLVTQKKFLPFFHNLPLISTVLAMLIIVLLSIIYPYGFELGWEIFVKYRLLGQDWFLLTIAIIIMMIITPIIRKIDSDIVIFSYSIALYVLLLFLMVSLYGYEKKDHTVGRMVNHIVPLCTFWVFLSFSQIIGKAKRNLLNT